MCSDADGRDDAVADDGADGAADRVLHDRQAGADGQRGEGQGVTRKRYVLAWVENKSDLIVDGNGKHGFYAYEELLAMRAAAHVPDMTLHGYISNARAVMLMEYPVTCTFIDVLTHRPARYQYAVVEVDSDVVWLLDLYDAQIADDQMTAEPGRLLVVRTVDAAVAAAALGW